MDLLPICNSCTPIHRQPTLYRKLSSPSITNFPYNSLKCRRKTTSELQTPVGVTGLAGGYSPSIPTHKVTVHDRQRGVVHEFFVPEVCLLILLAAGKGKKETEVDFFLNFRFLFVFIVWHLRKQTGALFGCQEKFEEKREKGNLRSVCFLRK